jgi:lipopolysaccharide exporter
MPSLRKEAIGAVKWTGFSSGVITLLQFLQLIVLSRFLTAEEFGLVAIVMVVIGFSQLFMDMGISNAIIYEQNITNEQLSSLYCLNIFSGIILTLFVFFISPFIAIFYNSDEIIPLLKLLSLTFFLNSTGNQYRVLLKKVIQFNILAKIDVIAAVGVFFCAVILAYQGYGAYSIIFATLGGTIISNVLLIIIGIKIHLPRLIFKPKKIKTFLNFGLYQMGQNSIVYFNNQFDVILIGKLLGTEVLGIYSVTKQLVMRPSKVINPIITNVAFPVMAKVQNDTERLKSIYLKILNTLSSVNFPIHLIMALLSNELIMILLGEKWISSIEIFRILTIYALIRSTMSPAGSLVLAKGRADIGFWWSFAGFIYIPLAIYIGHFWGVLGIAYSLLSYQITFSIANWFFIVKKMCNATITEYYKPQIISLFISLITIIFTYFILSITTVEPILKICLWLIVSVPIYGLLSYLLNKPFFNELKNFIQKPTK